MKRLIWIPLAGFLLIAGAAVAAASPGLAEKAAGLIGQATGPTSTSSPSPEDTDGAEDANESTDSDADVDGKGGRGFHFEVGAAGSLLDDTLTDLVNSGVITQAQADAITDALAQAVEDKQAEFEAERAQIEQTWEQIQGFLEDGVITPDELAQLPADNPISNLEEILADGQITQEELDSVMVGPHFLRGPGGPGHFHLHRLPGGTAPDNAQPDDSGSDSSSGSNS
jgi:hypothetical protein